MGTFSVEDMGKNPAIWRGMLGTLPVTPRVVLPRQSQSLHCETECDFFKNESSPNSGHRLRLLGKKGDPGDTRDRTCHRTDPATFNCRQLSPVAGSVPGGIRCWNWL